MTAEDNSMVITTTVATSNSGVDTADIEHDHERTISDGYMNALTGNSDKNNDDDNNIRKVDNTKAEEEEKELTDRVEVGCGVADATTTGTAATTTATGTNATTATTTISTETWNRLEQIQQFLFVDGHESDERRLHSSSLLERLIGSEPSSPTRSFRPPTITDYDGRDEEQQQQPDPIPFHDDNDDDGNAGNNYNEETTNYVGPVANLCSATLGAGILSLPYAIMQCGLVAGCIMLGITASATVISIQILSQACEYYQCFTYEQLVAQCTGAWGRKLTQLCILLFCGGCAVAYLIAVGDILQLSGLTIPFKYDDHDDHHDYGSRALSMILVWALAMFPLSTLRTMRSLQCASSIGMASIATLVMAAAVHWMEDVVADHPLPDDHHNSTNGTTAIKAFIKTAMMRRMAAPLSFFDEFQESNEIWGDIESNFNDFFGSGLTQTSNTTHHDHANFSRYLWPQHGWKSILLSCPIILFAFSCQVNVCAIYHELASPLSLSSSSETAGRIASSETRHLNHAKLQRMHQVTVTAVTVCAVLYASLSIITMADFGTTILPNILLNYTPPVGIIQVACICMAFAVILAFPLNIFPARITILQLLPPERRLLFLTPNETLTAALLSEQIEEVDIQSAPIQLHGDVLSHPEQGSRTVGMLGPIAANDDNATGESSRGVMDDAETPIDAENLCNGSEINAFISPHGQQDTSNGDRFDCTSPAVTESASPMVHNCSTRRHYMVTIALAGSALVLALVIPNISIVFGILGGTTTSILGFILPGWLGVCLYRDHPTASNLNQYILSWLLLLSGILVGILTTTVTVSSLILER